MADMPHTTASKQRRLPGTRWSAIRLNWRWVAQAAALIAGIYFFMRAFDTGKLLLIDFSFIVILNWAVWVLLFSSCFLVLMFTSYLKERGSGTLRKRIAIFEKLVAALHLKKYSESGGESDQPA